MMMMMMMTSGGCCTEQSMSIICGALHWLLNGLSASVDGNGQEEDAAAVSKSQDPDWVNEFVQQKKQEEVHEII